VPDRRETSPEALSQFFEGVERHLGDHQSLLIGAVAWMLGWGGGIYLADVLGTSKKKVSQGLIDFCDKAGLPTWRRVQDPIIGRTREREGALNRGLSDSDGVFISVDNIKRFYSGLRPKEPATGGVYLNEQERRLMAGGLATMLGRGGVSTIASAAKLNRNTVAKGAKEFLRKKRDEKDLSPGSGRLRRGSGQGVTSQRTPTKAMD